MLSKSLSYGFVCLGAVVVVSSCSSSDAATVQAAGAGGAEAGVDASGGTAGTGGMVDAAVEEAAIDQKSDDCTPGEGRCHGTAPQVCDQARMWQACPNCAFLDTDPHNCGACGNDCKGVTCSGGKCNAVITVATPGGEAVAVDDANVYWLADAWDADAGSSKRSVMKAGLGGESPISLWHGSVGHAFAINTEALFLGIGIFDSDAGWVAGLVKLGLTGGAPDSVATTAWTPVSIVLDDTYVYWTSGNHVAKVAQVGGEPTVLANGPWVGSSITIDSMHAYWTDLGNSDVPGSVVRVSLNGGVADIVASNQSWAHSLALDTASVYWLTWDAVMKRDKTGGTPVVIASTHNGDKGQIAIDDTYIYWTTSEGGGPDPKGTVRRAPLNGGPTVTLAEGLSQPMGIALDATHVYWVTSEAVMKVAK